MKITHAFRKDMPPLKGVDLLRHVIHTAPFLPGAYEMCDDDGNVMYVGKAKSLKKRLMAYTRVAQLPMRLQRMVHALCHIRLTTTHTEVEALLLEYNLIKKHHPPCNVLLKDGQSFVTLALTHHAFPQLLRQRGRRSQADVFGPYPSSSMADETLRTLQRVFMLRTCKDPEFQNRIRPCLNYDMKLCSAPCVGRISQESYQQSVHQAQLFLKGRSHHVQEQLSQQMEQASHDLRFEEAAQLRDRLTALATVQTRQHIMVDAVENADIIAIHGERVRVLSYRHHHLIGGHTHILQHVSPDVSHNLSAFLHQYYIIQEAPPLLIVNVIPNDMENIKILLKGCRVEQSKRGARRDLLQYALQGLGEHQRSAISPPKALQELAELVSVSAIHRLEIYDNSHIQATNTTGVMVVVTDEKGHDPSHTRSFKLPSGIHDDGALMMHTLTQRFEQTDVWPDLIIVDGGLIQIHAAQAVLNMLGLSIPVLGLVKHASRKDGLERLMRGDGSTINVDARSEFFQQLLQWRDAAHRGAVHRHRQKRTKQMVKSALDDIDGIGPQRKKALLQRFGSVRGIAAAAVSDIACVPGISLQVAERIYHYFRVLAAGVPVINELSTSCL